MAQDADLLIKQISELIGTPPTGQPITDRILPIGAEDRQKLEKLLGHNLQTSKDLVRLIERMVSVDVGGTQVELQPRLLERLKSRCFSMAFPDFVTMIVKRSLEEYCGLR